MKITARIELPKKLTAKFKELKMPLSGGYDKGYEDGYQEGYTEGSAFYDEFWDNYQANGNRTDYAHSFRGKGWNEFTFKPKYKICPTQATNAFTSTAIVGDLREMCEIDTSNLEDAAQMFYGAKTITGIGIIDCRKLTQLNYIFSTCSALEVIELLKVKETNEYPYTFNGAVKLREIIFEGVIGKKIDFKSCPLSVASMKNIISCLKDFNGTGSEYSQKVTFSDNSWATLEADSNAPDGGTWKEYVQNVLCWNV